MDWLFDNPQVFLLVLFVAFSLIKRIFDSKKAAENPPADEEDPFESWVPVPQKQAPSVPPPLARSHIPPTGRRSIPPPPPLPSREQDASMLKRQQEMMERLRHAKDIKESKANITGGAAATQGRVSGTGKSITAVGPGLRGRLRNRSEIRKAILMREILDRPLGLR